jgi:hypothetical protein
MATLVSSHAGDHSTELTPRKALNYAWYIWLTLLAIPFIFFIYVAWRVSNEAPSVAIDRPFTNGWFISSVAYMILAVPAAFFIRSRWFKGYWSGDCVAPRNYLIGMSIMWGVTVIGGLWSLVGCLGSRSLLPCFFPALVAFVMFAIHWPNGRAMVSRGRGAADDPETYEEPR